MKKLFTLALLLCAAGQLRSQLGCLVWPYGCLDTIPAQAMVITGTQTITLNASCFWVCPGDTLYLAGTNNTIYAEAGSAVIVYGHENFIEMKENGYVEVDTGSLACGVWYESTVTVVDNGPNTQKTSCADVNFDYGESPSPGCTPSVVGAEPPTLSFYPNPANHIVYVRGATADTRIEFVDGRGRRQWYAVEGSAIDVSGLPAGVYVIILHSGSGSWVSGKMAILN